MEFSAVERAYRVWLAGLGTLSIAYRRASTALTRLVVDGRALKAQGARLAREAANDLHAQATGVFVPLQVHAEKQAAATREAWKKRFDPVRRRFGGATKRDVDGLNVKIAALTRKRQSVS